jgi:hypothetical protein
MGSIVALLVLQLYNSTMSEPFILFSILQNCVFYCMINFVVTLPVAGGSRICVTEREYYCYKLQMRPDEMNILFYGGRPFQQFLVDMYVKVEYMRLDWYSLPKHQKFIRAELYRGIVDTLQAGEARATMVGRRLVLPRDFTGGDRDVQAIFLDAMTLVQHYGKLDYFITMTCNSYWEEVIKEHSWSDTSGSSRAGGKGLHSKASSSS